MKITLMKAIIYFLAMTFYTSISAQVQGVNYWIKYNADSLWYDCYLIINNGSATGNSIHAIQFNAQYSIVTTTGDSIQLVKSYYPKYDANTPAPWSISSIIKSPLAQPQNDFYSVIPSLGGSPLASYIDGLNAGDTIKLFSIKRIGQTTLCGKELRIFENASDPGSSEPGMASADFSNGFSVGNTNQIYEGNSEQLSAINPMIVSAVLSCSSGLEIDLTASAHSNQGPLTYLWTGPLGYSSTNEDVLISPATASNNGIYTIIVTDSIGCKDSLQVDGVSKPSAGPDQTVCANTSGHLIIGSPTSGTWSNISGNPAGATRSNVSSGVDAVSFNASASGNYRFKYSIGTSGTCTDTMRFTVNPIPSVTITDVTGCVGETLNNILVGGAAGTWSSSNPSVATVTTVNNTTATVTCIAIGTVTFTFTRTSSGCVNQTASFTVNPSPIIVGMENLCVGGTDHLNPNNGGTWSSATTSVATVTNAGVVTANAAGTSVLTYVDFNGCKDTATQIVLPKPTVNITGNDFICIGATTTLSSNMAGTWESSNPLVATVSGNTVTGVTEGSATFTFTALGGCTSDPLTLNVTTAPFVSITVDTICVGFTSQAFPSTGGTWVSSNALIATISANGSIAGINPGTTTFTFTSNTSLCSSTTENFVVISRPQVSVPSDNVLCIGETTTLTVTGGFGGTWTSSQPAVASINATSGIVTAVSAGTNVRFTYTNPNGCTSAVSSPIEVKLKPTVNFIGPNPICINGITNVTSNGAVGTWASGTPAVVLINNSGVVTAVGAGLSILVFTQTDGSCLSDPLIVTVQPKPIISTLDNTIAINETTQFSSNEIGGSWESINSNIATVNSAGLVTGVSKGKTFIKYNSALNCESELFEIEVTGYKFVLTGFCFTDLNQNDIYDDGEDFPLSNCAITRTGSSIVNYTDADGYFNFEVDSAINEITYVINFGLWIENSITRTFNINKPVTYDFVGFKPSPNAGVSASVSLSSAAPLCNTFSTLNPIAFNESSTLIDGYLVIEYDNRTYFSETLPLPSGGSGNKLIWDFKDLAPGKMFSPYITYFVPDEINTPDSLHFTAWILEKVTGDTLSTFDFSEEIICNTNAPTIVSESWPNREGEDNYTLNYELINYNIRYQNKGNSLARKIVIEMVIDEHLDENSLIIKESTFSYEASREGSLLTVVMDSIELSNNREEEIGNLSFSFAIKQGTPDYSKIYHSARIAMDNGFEFTTSPTLNTVVSLLPCDLVNDEIIQNDALLTIQANGNTYSWYDCETDQVLQSENTADFFPTENGSYYVIVEGENCKTVTDCFIYISTGNDNYSESNITLYPNPTTGFIQLKGLYDSDEVKLLNYRGERLMECKCASFDISEMPKGIYFIEIKSFKKSEVIKVSKL